MADRPPSLDELLAPFDAPLPRPRFDIRLALATGLVAAFYMSWHAFVFSIFAITFAIVAAFLFIVCYFGNLTLGLSLSAATIAALALVLWLRPKPVAAQQVPAEIEAPCIELAKEDQPELFAFVERLFRAARLPPPARIEVTIEPNAAVYLYDYSLILGLPLVAGMNLPQLTCILAHECGHAVQRTARAARYMAANFEARFHHAAGLRRASEVVANILTRQSERYADRFAASVVGARVFAESSRESQLLIVGWAAVTCPGKDDSPQTQPFDDLALATLAMLNVMREDPEWLENCRKEVFDRPTGWLDTHPNEPDRIAAIERLNPRGIFHVDAPATILLRNFDDLCRRATHAYYEQVFGPEIATKD